MKRVKWTDKGSGEGVDRLDELTEIQVKLKLTEETLTDDLTTYIRVRAINIKGYVDDDNVESKLTNEGLTDDLTTYLRLRVMKMKD